MFTRGGQCPRAKQGRAVMRDGAPLVWNHNEPLQPPKPTWRPCLYGVGCGRTDLSLRIKRGLTWCVPVGNGSVTWFVFKSKGGGLLTQVDRIYRTNGLMILISSPLYA